MSFTDDVDILATMTAPYSRLVLYLTSGSPCAANWALRVGARSAMAKHHTRAFRKESGTPDSVSGK
jgi:hypothetical protein